MLNSLIKKNLYIPMLLCMKHITLILILLFIPFSLFSQGIGCSKEAGSETELETYLSKMIKDTEERKLISKNQ